VLSCVVAYNKSQDLDFDHVPLVPGILSQKTTRKLISAVHDVCIDALRRNFPALPHGTYAIDESLFRRRKVHYEILPSVVLCSTLKEYASSDEHEVLF
jgi:hypothetical protein